MNTQRLPSSLLPKIALKTGCATHHAIPPEMVPVTEPQAQLSFATVKVLMLAVEVKKQLQSLLLY